MKELDAYRIAFRDLPMELTEAEVNAEKQDSISVAMTDDRVTNVAASDQTALFVRVSGDKTGFALTENLEESPESVIKTALENSRYLQSEKKEIINTSQTLPKQIREKEKEHITTDEIKKILHSATEKIKKAYPEFLNITVKASENIHTAGVVNSRGCDQTYSRKVAELSVTASGRGGERDYFTVESVSATEFDKINPDFISQRLNIWQSNKVPDMDCKAGIYKAVLDSSVMTNIFTTAWMLFSGINYIENSTIYRDKFGEKIASDKVTIVDLPVCNGNGYEYPFDCEGSKGIKATLIDNGVFTGLLHNLQTAAALGQAATGNAGRTPTFEQSEAFSSLFVSVIYF
jgi:PmbA protein